MALIEDMFKGNALTGVAVGAAALFLGPTVLPGAYSVRLAVDGKTSTAPLTVKMDPRVKTSLAGLQKKFETESRLAAIVNESTHALLQADSRILEGSDRIYMELLGRLRPGPRSTQSNPRTGDRIL